MRFIPNLARSLVLLLLVTLVSFIGTRPSSATDDPHWQKQWAPAKIGAPAAWSSTTGTGVKIGIVDTGIDLDHEDLAGKIAASASCVGTDGDPTKCTGTGQDTDPEGHGTHVSGIAAAYKDNAKGIAGIAPDAQLVVANVFSGNSARFADVNAGIQYVVDRGARVVNLSLGEDIPLISGLFGGANSLEPGIAYAWARGAVPVLAAGNTNLLGLGSSNYGNLDAIVVGATGRNDELASYSSSTGDAKWALLAPGGNSSQGGDEAEIYSTRPGDTYGYEEGTSMAAPHVSGAAALLLARGLSNQQVVDTLLATVAPMPCGSGSPNCKGRLDVGKAVASVVPSTTAPANLDPVTRISGADRIETAIAASVAGTPAGAAQAAVLVRHDQFADALAGTPLAVAKNGPLLLTPSSALDSRVEAELERALPTGSSVYLLGGTGALSLTVEERVKALGYQAVRYAGSDRYDTAVKVAEGLGGPSTVLLATGLDFPDALAGGAAAGKVGGAVLLTAGATMPNTTAVYLNTHAAARRYALGGPASQADPQATPLVGENRYETARKVAETFFAAGPTTVGVASGAAFADALGGGAHIARQGGPLVLSAPDALPTTVREYLASVKAAVTSASVYGGPAALAERVRTDVQTAIT